MRLIGGGSVRGSVALGLIAGLLVCSGCHAPPEHRLRHIILITLDTTRADRLGCYGYGRATSPNLDRLAAESTLYEEAYATSSWTLPSHASLFTGKFTSSHGAEYDPKGPLRLVDALEKWDETWTMYRVRGLPESQTTLAQLLEKAGYATGAVVGGPWMKRIFGLDRGFDFYDDSGITKVRGRVAADVSDSAMKWIHENRGRDFFLFLNYYDPHVPYDPPDGFGSAFLPKDPAAAASLDRAGAAGVRYDAEILYMDHHIGRLFDELKALDLYNDALIVVAADHGELLGEHGLFGHGKTLFHQELHIPLMIKRPRSGEARDRVRQPVQLVDVLPAIAEMAGIPPPPGIQGDPPSHVKHPIIAEVYPFPPFATTGESRAIIELPYKLLWNSKAGRSLFNIQDDPGETRNLLESEGQRGERMLGTLKAYLKRLPGPGTAGPQRTLDKETQESLKSLGYVK